MANDKKMGKEYWLDNRILVTCSSITGSVTPKKGLFELNNFE
jgi:hypothetical protein